MKMSLYTPQPPTQTDSRTNTILDHTTKVDRRPDLWERGDDSLASLLGTLVETIPKEEAWSIGMLVESLADQMANGTTQFDGEETVIDLAQGHHKLNQMIAPTTLERAEAHRLIKPASIYDGNQQHTPAHIARRTLWDLGDKALQYIDKQAIRGLDEYESDLRSDPNEGMAHRFMTRLAEHYYLGQDDVDHVRTYVRAGNVADVNDELESKRYDLIVYGTDRSIHSTCEIETRPVDKGHIIEDAKLQAHLPGDSDWLCWRKQDVNRLLDTLVQTGAIELPAGHPGWSCQEISTNESMARLSRVRSSSDGSIATFDSPIVTSANTADNMRELAQDARPEVFHSIDF